MKETLYPTLEEALYLHDVLMQRFGSKSGVLDKGHAYRWYISLVPCTL